MEIKKSHARISSMLEQYYERLLDKRKYTENHMLAVINPYRQAPLTAMILFTTKEACAVRVRLEDGADYAFTTDRETRHRIPIFYLHAGERNEITIELIDEKQEVFVTKKIVLYTNSLPNSLENMIEIEKNYGQCFSHDICFWWRYQTSLCF